MFYWLISYFPPGAWEGWKQTEGVMLLLAVSKAQQEVKQENHPPPPVLACLKGWRRGLVSHAQHKLGDPSSSSSSVKCRFSYFLPEDQQHTIFKSLLNLHVWTLTKWRKTDVTFPLLKFFHILANGVFHLASLMAERNEDGWYRVTGHDTAIFTCMLL